MAPPFFNAAVDAFVRAHPSTRGDVNRYGGDLPSFLAAYGLARTLAYLPDVARLEWTVDQSAIAADAPPFDLAALASLREDSTPPCASCCIRRRGSSSRAIRSSISGRSISPGTKVQPTSISAKAAIRCWSRAGARGVGIERLQPGEAALLRAFAANAPLGTAASRASEAESSFDLPAALRRHVAEHILVAFRTPEHPAEESQR